MAIDASIYNALLQPRKSAIDYANDYAAADDQRAQSAYNTLLMQDKQAQMMDAAGQRSRLRGVQNDLQQLGAGATDDQRIAVYERAGMFEPADKIRTSVANRKKVEGEATKQQSEALDAAIKRYRGALDFIDTPQGAARWLQAQYQDPVTAEYMGRLTPFEQAAQRIPQDPAQFAEWRLKVGLGMKDHEERLRKGQEFALKRNNELIDESGNVNTTLQGLKLGLAKAGASNVSINTGQKGLDNEFKLRGEFKGEPVYKAHQEMQSAYSQIKQSLAQESPAGDLAGATKIMKLLDPGSVVRESELGMAMQASGLMDRATNYANMVITGQKLTPQQRKDFQKLADALYSESVKQFNSKRSEYEKLGGEYGLNAGRALGGAAAMPETGSVDDLVNKYRTPKGK